MGFDYYEDDDDYKSLQAPFYHLILYKSWFRGKDVFTHRVAYYERQLVDKAVVRLPINAGNMIYIMMRQLKSVDWEKQDALVASYRNLMYKMSYVDVWLYANNPRFLHIQGQKNDVMVALSFMTQVYPEELLRCQVQEYFNSSDKEQTKYVFDIQNGEYVGKNAVEFQRLNDALPDIWKLEFHQPGYLNDNDSETVCYDPTFYPQSNESFVLPDGRTGLYVRMNERFSHAEMYGNNCDLLTVHNISASLMKDFEDLISSQTEVPYDLYRMRYVAFMNKTHELERLLGGLEISCYDKLPIGERGLPFASDETISRTNARDENSIKYILDKIKNHKKSWTVKEKRELSTFVSKSIIERLSGYDLEYQMYQETNTSEEFCRDIRNQKCTMLYMDLVDLEWNQLVTISEQAYRGLCNDPRGSIYSMTEFERQKRRKFGRGYVDFLIYQLNTCQNKKQRIRYQIAFSILKKKYLNKGGK